jgi:hypothetical protein
MARHLRIAAAQLGPLNKSDSRTAAVKRLTNLLREAHELAANPSSPEEMADVLMILKKDSSKWIKTKRRPYRNFHWQSGYGAFSVSQSNVAQVVKYIEKQKEHHRRRTFQEEFRAFLKRYQVPYDDEVCVGLKE